MQYIYIFAKFIVTGFGIGKSKIAPGTFGSLLGFPCCYLIMHFILKNQIIFDITGFSSSEQQFLTLFFIELIFTLGLFIIGIYFTSIYIKDKPEHDLPEIVIDEIVGQMLTIILCSASIILIYSSSVTNKIEGIYIDILFLFILPFVLFRIFDILKPWPINWFDKNIKGAFGVMFDDILAAIFASIMHYAIVLILIDFYPANV